MINIQCRHCSRQYNVDDKLAGKRVKCRECGHPILVATQASVPASPGAPPSDEPDIFGLMEAAEAETAENRLEAVALKANHSAPPPGGRACPSCHAAVPPKAVICLSCGYNFKTGRIPDAPTHSPHEIPLAEPAAAPRRRRVSQSKLRNNDMLNSIDRYLGVAVFILFALGVAVWCINVVKAAPSFSIFLLLPTLITTLLFMAIVAPLMLLAMQAVAYGLKFAPRSDTYMRVLMVLMLPLGMALLCGASVAKNPGMGDMISGAWLAAGVLFVFLFRDDLVPFLATTISGAVAGFIGWGIAVFAASLVSLATGPLYADALPPGPWQSIASGHSPAPKPANPSENPAQPGAVVSNNNNTTTPAPSTPGPIASNNTSPDKPDTTGMPFGGPTPAAPGGITIPPAPINNNAGSPGTTVIKGGPPEPAIPPQIPNNNADKSNQVAMVDKNHDNTTTTPPVPGGNNTAPNNTDLTKPLHPDFLTDVQVDSPDFQGVRDIVTPLTSTNWMISVKTVDGGTALVQRWATDPLAKRGELTFQELPKQPNTYAISPNGAHLIVLQRFPKWQLEICNFDNRPSRKIAIAENLPPGEQDAVPSLIGFVDNMHYLLRWDLMGRSAIRAYNCPGGDSFRGTAIESSDSDINQWAISPDGRSVAVVSRFPTNRELLIYDTLGNGPVRRFRPLAMDFICKGIAFSPDSRKIAVYAVAQAATTVVSFNFKGEAVNTAILPPQPFANNGMGMRPRFAMNNANNVTPAAPRGLIWSKNNNLWIIDGTELYDPESGRKVGSFNIPGPLDQDLIGNDSIALIQRTGEDTRRIITAKFDDGAIRTAMEKLKGH
jgi:predicted Zn finger-like uncharacterized protein